MSKPNGWFHYSLWIVIASFALTGISASVTNLCAIYDYEIDYHYDLNELIGGNKDVVVISERRGFYNDTLRIQLCAPLMKKCNGEDGFAVCIQYENGTERAIGRFPPRVSVKRGQVTFTMPGTFCNAHPENATRIVNYTIQVFVQCDYQAVGDTRPVMDQFNPFGCRIYMTWKTALVCGPKTHIDCTATYNNEHYDLTSLTRYSGNYNIRTETAKSSKLVLNICHSVVRAPDAPCSTGAGACIYIKKFKKYINLGNVQDSPVFTNGHVLLEYRDGDVCDIPNSTSSVFIRYRTTVTFVCSLAFEDTIPEYAGKSDECHYQIIWNTPIGCSVETQLDYRAYKPNNCTILNPITKSTYNLQPLMNIDYQITQFGIQYKLSVCGPVTNTSCEAGTGICDMDYHLSLGEANSLLLWDQGGPYLRYANGNRCGRDKHHVTYIAFICGPEQLAYEPMIMEQEKCFTIIHWNTNLVCESRVECKTDDDDEINLTPLIQYKRNYVVKVSDIEYHINICRPLVPVATLTCEHGSAACEVEQTLNGKYVGEITMGYPVNRPTLNHKQQTVLRYTHGSPCNWNKQIRLSTNITFICGNDTKGYPVYAGKTDCTFMFTWATRLACKIMIGTWMPPCTVIETVLGEEYDLSLLYMTKQVHYVEGRQGKVYSINICNNENYCNGSAVCDDQSNDYGSLTNILFDYKHGDIKLEYLNGSQCDNVFAYTSTIRLICSEFMIIGTPKLLLESECGVQFIWETGVICPKKTDMETIEEESDDERAIFIIPTEKPPPYAATSVIMTVSGIMLVVSTMFTMATCYQHRYQIKNYFSTYYNMCMMCISYFRRRTSVDTTRYMATPSDQGSSVESLNLDTASCETEFDVV